MQALLVRAHGGLDALEIVDHEVPEIREDEVLVRVKASGINHLDVWVRKGVEGHAFPLPLIPGCDGAGVVEEVGSLVSNARVGDRVALSPGLSCGTCRVCLEGRQNLCRDYGILGETRNGTAAEYVAVPARNLLPMDEAQDFTEAAALPLTALTAHHMLAEKARVRPGMDVLIHAAGSGVSVVAIQIARALGARVMVTASTAAKLEKARELGAELTINYTEEDFSRRVKEFTGKRGVDVVVDHVGQATFERSLRSLAKGGVVVSCGCTSGPELRADFRPLFFKNLAIMGSTMGGMGEMHQVWGMIRRGLIRPVIDRVLPLSKAREAHAALEGREAFGKIILEPGA